MNQITESRQSELTNLAAQVQKSIAASTKNGVWRRSYPEEQPTKESIRRSIPWAWIGLSDCDEINYVMDIIYPKLRKNGILAKLR